MCVCVRVLYALCAPVVIVVFLLILVFAITTIVFPSQICVYIYGGRPGHPNIRSLCICATSVCLWWVFGVCAPDHLSTVKQETVEPVQNCERTLHGAKRKRSGLESADKCSQGHGWRARRSAWAIVSLLHSKECIPRLYYANQLHLARCCSPITKAIHQTPTPLKRQQVRSEPF